MAKKEQRFYWQVTLELPGNKLPAGVEHVRIVFPIARDKLQASHRAAGMLDVEWRKTARYMTVSGPFKAQAQRVREWNRSYPQWSTERETDSSLRSK
jgi:hypothetical protein